MHEKYNFPIPSTFNFFAAPSKGWKDPSAEWNLVNVGANAGLSTVKAERELTENSKLSLQGPSCGVDAGVKVTGERVGVDLMAEASAAQAMVSAGPAFVNANLNANTGVKVGTDGVKVGFLGFGVTLGVGGKFSLDTPVGSAGVATGTHTHEYTNEDKMTYTN